MQTFVCQKSLHGNDTMIFCKFIQNHEIDVLHTIKLGNHCKNLYLPDKAYVFRKIWISSFVIQQQL